MKVFNRLLQSANNFNGIEWKNFFVIQRLEEKFCVSQNIWKERKQSENGRAMSEIESENQWERVGDVENVMENETIIAENARFRKILNVNFLIHSKSFTLFRVFFMFAQ